MAWLRIKSLCQQLGGVRSSVVARWSAGQQVERLIIHQGHDSEQNSAHLPRLFTAKYTLFTVHNGGLKHHIFITYLSTNFPTHCETLL